MIKPSKRLRTIMVLLHALALGACLSASLLIVFKGVLLVAIGIHFRFINKQLNEQYYALKHSEASGWAFNDGSGFASVRVLPSTVISTAVMFLHIEIRKTNTHINHSLNTLPLIKSRRKKSIFILTDMLSEDEYRRLIVKLKTSVIK